MEDERLEPGFYWIRAKWIAGDRWVPAEWQPGGWVEGAAGIWYYPGNEEPISSLADLADVTVGARIEEPHE